MISFNDACQCIAEQHVSYPPEMTALADSLGKVLADDVVAPIDLPPFDNSAVDGFALSTTSLSSSRHLVLDGLVRARGQNSCTLRLNTVVRIMTGAPMPHNANAVAMLEDVTVQDDHVLLTKEPRPYENIRFHGEDVTKGTLIGHAGTTINPQLIALYAGLGLTKVPVFRSPRIHIIATGDELVTPGQPLHYGQVYYLMDAMLKAQCARMGIHDVTSELLDDDHEAISGALNRALGADIVLLTGGMSKGEYDFARLALKENKVNELFYRGAWRPGKPLYFGRKGNTLVFGMPGNPVAAFICFHVFVARAISFAMKAGPGLKPMSAIALNEMSKKPGLTFFARAIVDESNGLYFLPNQGSHQIFSLSKANALCIMPEPKAIVKTGEVVQYYCL